MTQTQFKLSAFGDEIADDLDEQLALLQELKVGYLELRKAWGKGIMTLSDGDIARVQERCDAYHIQVSCLGSPVGKSPLVDPLVNEEANLTRLFQIGEQLRTRLIRVFSFYPPDTSTNDHYDQHLPETIDRLGQLAQQAQRAGFTLLLENERGIVGDTPERCHQIVSTIDSPHLRFLWDPANFVIVGVAEPMTRGWALLQPYTTYVHIKDATLADRKVQAAGAGDGQVGELLTRLNEDGYGGFLALEPHLASGGRHGGFSGSEGMTYAVQELRSLMKAVGCEETIVL